MRYQFRCSKSKHWRYCFIVAWVGNFILLQFSIFSREWYFKQSQFYHLHTSHPIP